MADSKKNNEQERHHVPSHELGHPGREAERKAAKAKEPAERIARREAKEAKALEPTPTWYKAIMFGLMLLGLLWIIVYYLGGGLFPIPGIGGWNIFIGFGIAMIGFFMTTRWR
ncbi:cell division protein CrgA [Neomicrococcus lactis]|uniref:cell division protein CrgA n=1 Tax=Neomicrococcus lactis TaxID=732241 RepID=UPI003A5C8892